MPIVTPKTRPMVMARPVNNRVRDIRRMISGPMGRLSLSRYPRLPCSS